MDAEDWKRFLQEDARSATVSTIKHDLLRFLPIYIQCEPERLNSFAVKFEEMIYATATSKLNYLERISSAMKTISTKNMPHDMQSNYANNSNESSVLARIDNFKTSENNEKGKDPISPKDIPGTSVPSSKKPCVARSTAWMNQVISNAERDLVFPEKATSRVLKLEVDLFLANLSITEKIQEHENAENHNQNVRRLKDAVIMAKNNEIDYLRDQIQRLRELILVLNERDDSDNDDGDGDDNDDHGDPEECVSEEHN